MARRRTDDEVDHDTTLRATALAPAKLNLLLAVGDKRADGFHEVVTVLQTLDLADRIDVDLELWNSPVVDVLVEAPDVPGGDTLVTRAVESLLARAGVGARVWVTIEKEIPIGGGLGGGSSDAAAALRTVNSLLRRPVGEAAMREIASEIGSDVTFFLLGPTATAIARGRGELVQRVAPFEPKAWLLAFPNVHQSTADVYELHEPTILDALPIDDATILQLAADPVKRNDLAGPARAACEALDKLVGALEDAGGHPIICGSGATVAVPVASHAERRAFEGVATTAIPGCWLRVAWTTAP
ncbi:MAG: IspE [Thermoleophilia bacterium]|nr:IspE [Thermoleophilia bacterium]